MQPLSDEQFKLEVMETLGELKAGMKSLVGNGQPGRVGKIEERLDGLEKFTNQNAGSRRAWTHVASAICSALALAISYFRHGR